MHDITLRDSPRFVICTHGLNGATFTNVTIDSAGERNTDGFHIQGRDVYIGQSSVTNDDDCVPISGDSSNITVEDLECFGYCPLQCCCYCLLGGTFLGPSLLS